MHRNSLQPHLRLRTEGALMRMTASSMNPPEDLAQFAALSVLKRAYLGRHSSARHESTGSSMRPPARSRTWLQTGRGEAAGSGSKGGEGVRSEMEMRLKFKRLSLGKSHFPSECR